ncbi:MAG: hypothetical protein QW547_02620 [Candidatus Bathyarchaeia archaeon]
MVRRVELRVVREKPRDRSSFRDLCGFLDVSIVVDDGSYLHVGAGREVFEADVEKLKELYVKRGIIDISLLRGTEYQDFASTSRGVVIPGSSVKGNVRAKLELSFHNFQGSVRSCFIKAGIIRGISIGTSGWRHQRVWSETVFEDRGFPCDFTRIGSVCLLCDLFGTSGLKGLIDFSDFVCPDVKLEALNLPYGIKVRAAPPGTTFNGRIDFTNLKDYELGLLLLGMGIMNSRIGRSVILGRFKYRSLIGGKRFGRVRYRINGLMLNRFSTELSVGSLHIRPETTILDEGIDELCKLLVDSSSEHFKNEIKIVDEVGILDGL